jgi:hypothetical protein
MKIVVLPLPLGRRVTDSSWMSRTSVTAPNCTLLGVKRVSSISSRGWKRRGSPARAVPGRRTNSLLNLLNMIHPFRWEEGRQQPAPTWLGRAATGSSPEPCLPETTEVVGPI